MKTKYQISEILAKETFTNFCQQQNFCKIKRFTTEDFADYDVVYTNENGNNITIGEIKYRKNKVTDFDTWFLEKDKYDRLIQIANNSTNKPRVTYINHFIDNITAIWDLTEIDVTKLELQRLEMQENDYSDKKVYKWVFKLPIILSKRFETDKNKPLFYEYNYNQLIKKIQDEN